MASGALFGNSSNRSQSKNLVEFRAGKMHMEGKMVHPDKRKGLIYLYQSEDSLMHFCWKDRTKGTVEDDLIIFPEDVEFKRVPACKTGRVYILKFKSSSRKFFFWMQEPKTDKDDEHSRKVNELLNNPPTPGSSRAGSGGGGAFSGLPPELAAGLGEGELHNLLGNMSQQQLMQLLGGMGMGGMGGLSALLGGNTAGRPSTGQTDTHSSSRVPSSPGARATDSAVPATPQQPAPTTPAVPAAPQRPAAADRPSSAGGSAIQLSDLQNILSGLGAGAEGGPRDAVDLSSVVTPDVMIPLLANDATRVRLLPFLPESETLPRTEEELRNTVSSPQFQQALSSFSAALASGQLGPLMEQFGLGNDASTAAAQGDVEAFVKAMQNRRGTDDEKKE